MPTQLSAAKTVSCMQQMTIVRTKKWRSFIGRFIPLQGLIYVKVAAGVEFDSKPAATPFILYLNRALCRKENRRESFCRDKARAGLTACGASRDTIIRK